MSRAQMRLRTKQLDEGVHAAVGTISFSVAFGHLWLARPDEDRANWLANILQIGRRQQLQSILEHGLQSPYFEPALRRYAALLPLWNRPCVLLVILDEATEGFAPVIRREIWSCISLLKSRDQSILMIDKNLQILERLADRHYVIEKGRTMWSGTTLDLECGASKVQKDVGL